MLNSDRLYNEGCVALEYQNKWMETLLWHGKK